MNELMRTAFDSFDEKQNELNGKALVVEIAIFGRSLAPTEALRELRVLYLDAYEELATYFVDEYRRVNKHSSDATTSALQPWLDQCVPRIAVFHSLGLHRHDYRSEPWAGDRLYLEACADLFNELAKKVAERFRKELAKARAEFVSKRRRKRNERVEKGIWALVGFVLGIVASLITALALHHFKLAS